MAEPTYEELLREARGYGDSTTKERTSLLDLLNELVLGGVMTLGERNSVMVGYDAATAGGVPFTEPLQYLVDISASDETTQKVWVANEAASAKAKGYEAQYNAQSALESANEAKRLSFLAKQSREGYQKTLDYLTGQQEIQARAGLFTQRTPEEKPEIPPMPSAEPAWTSAIEELPPALRAYWGSRPGEVLDPIAEARTRWWNTIQQVKRDAREEEFETERAVRKTAPGTPERVTAKEEQRGASRAAARLSEAEVPTDPLEAHMKGFPFIGKWLKLAPRQRGDYPSRYAPPAIWR